MKRRSSLLIILLFALFGVAKAQTNIQYHYNFGKHIYDSRKESPSALFTVEHFSTDPWGDNFGFMDVQSFASETMQVYYEFNRNLRFWDFPININLAYNGGMDSRFLMRHAYIAGASWTYFRPQNQFSLGFVMGYRHDWGAEKPHNMQTKAHWSWTSWNRVWTINGFAKLWTNVNDISESHVMFLSEPQFWMNLNQIQGFHDDFNLSIGTEIKLSYNFEAPDRFYVLPTLALKWTFK